MPRCVLMLFLLGCSFAVAEETANGWRGNATGLWPDAKPPLEWCRLPHGACEGLRGQATRPTEAAAGNAPPMDNGLLRDWLIVGPFSVANSKQDFDQDFLGGENRVEPTPDDRAGEKSWQRLEGPFDDPMVFGSAELPWLDLGKPLGFQTNQLAYAHTYLHSPRGGKARLVVEHSFGLKAWLNGREVYRSVERQVGLGFYTAISRHELQHLDQPSPRFECELKPGWNRLLIKVSSPPQNGFNEMRFCLRIMDPPDVPYETRNILWQTELPNRSTSTPIVVGDRLFLMAEPDELVCLDKRSGRVRWTAANDYLAAIPADERAKTPALAERATPLAEQLRAEPDRRRRLQLRRELQKTLTEIDEKKFAIAADGHFESHFGIVGFTMPTPVSDGRHVYVWCGMGVAACYDLDGQRRWITRVPTPHLSYGSSPALADGVLAVFLNQLYGLDAGTGKLLWTQPRVTKNVASILAAKLANQSVFVTQQGEVLRPRDGKLLFRPRGITTGDTGWSPPTLLGDTMYLPRYGVVELNLYDFAGCEADAWQPKHLGTISLPSEVNKLPNGRWLDRWTAGSPLIWQGLSYQTDIYGVLYVVDLATKRMVLRQETELRGLMHYNAVPVAASPTLVGRHVLIQDNQGTTLVLEPGPEYKVAARNRIATQLERAWPIPAQETLAYAPPILDENRLYLRGERFLYCVGR